MPADTAPDTIAVRTREVVDDEFPEGPVDGDDADDDDSAGIEGNAMAVSSMDNIGNI